MAVKITQPARNLREELNELRTPTGIAGEAMLRADTPQEQFNLIGAGRKNLIINGDFQVNQWGRISGTPISITTYGVAGYYIDRWIGYASGITANIQSSTNTVNGKNVNTVKVTATNSTSGEMFFQQRVESQPWFEGQVVTASVWVKSNNNTVGIRTNDGTTWGPYPAVRGTAVHSGSGEWELLTHTFTLGVQAASPTIQILATGVTSGDYYEVSMLQLELGKVATPFEHRSYGEELALCQRYYERISGTSEYFTGHGYNLEIYFTWPFAVPKRSASGQTVTYSGANAAVMFTCYGNTGTSGAIDGLLTGSPFTGSNSATGLTFYLKTTASTYTPYGTSVMARLDAPYYISVESEL